MFQLDFRESRPLYEQLKEKIKELIISGVLKPDDKIPSVREMAQSLTINPNTIQKAYKDLESEGFIYSVRAKGSFVSPREQAVSEVRLEELWGEMARILAELFYLNVAKEQVISFVNDSYQKRRLK